HVMGVTQAAGLSLKWFKDNFCEDYVEQARGLGVDVYDLINRDIAAVPAGSDRLIYLPYLMGERTAHLDPDSRGVFFGLSAIHTKAHLLRAVMEGVSYSLCDCNEILKEIDSVDFFDDIRTSDQGIISVDQEVEDSFIKEIVSMAPVKASEMEALNKERLRVVYTPLNGTGNFYVRKVLTEIGFPHLVVVESQELPDENFSTCPTPNPEKITAFNEGFKVLDKVDGDIIIATDPDCDRVGVCIYHDGMKVLLTGNQLGVLMLDYLCQVKPPSDGQLLIKSIVTTPLAAKIAERHGLKVCNTLTGFKYIGEIIAKLDAEGKKDRYYFGFEESHGYLMNPFIRDKDGVSSAMLTVCLAAYHKAQGRDLLQRLHEIYREYGPSYDKTRSFSFEGPYGKMAMDKVMDFFRQDVRESLGGFAVTEKIDYMEETGLPKADVVSFTLENSTQVVIRPSGTEPKIKLYLFESESGSGIEQALKSIVESFKNA
ncbi:MAG: FGGY-family carbohydrate kinase, partial [Emergencia sp.]